MRSSFDVLVFDLIGKFAHFRKFYSNSSSLTYLFPPRTTLEGIIAAMLGYNRDEYYDSFAPSKCLITVSPKTRCRALMQTVNNLIVKLPSDLNGKQGRTQIPTEILVPENFKDSLRYRIYFSHDDLNIMNMLENRIKLNKSFYPISLGSAQFLCHANFIDSVGNVSLTSERDQESVEISTPLLSDNLTIQSIVRAKNQSTKISMDIFPFHFGSGRTLGRNYRFIFERNFRSIRLLEPPFKTVSLSYRENGQELEEKIFFPETALSQ